MIKNQKQVSITKERLAEISKAKADFIERNKDNIDSAKYRLSINSYNGLIGELEDDLRVYESLVKGNFHCFQPKSLLEIGETLIAARLAQNMSQKQLGEKLGLKEQQIQRYEATDYETAAFHRIIEVATALKIQFNFEKIELASLNKDVKMFALPKDMSEEKVDSIPEKIQKESIILNIAS
jgi:transcriptional regulator with XRE-family HTH domain